MITNVLLLVIIGLMLSSKLDRRRKSIVVNLIKRALRRK